MYRGGTQVTRAITVQTIPLVYEDQQIAVPVAIAEATVTEIAKVTVPEDGIYLGTGSVAVRCALSDMDNCDLTVRKGGVGGTVLGESALVTATTERLNQFKAAIWMPAVALLAGDTIGSYAFVTTDSNNGAEARVPSSITIWRIA